VAKLFFLLNTFAVDSLLESNHTSDRTIVTGDYFSTNQSKAIGDTALID